MTSSIRKTPTNRGGSNRHVEDFKYRERKALREAVKDAISRRSVSDSGGDEIRIRSNRTKQYRFVSDPSKGSGERVIPGNPGYEVGDRIPKPEGGGGQGSGPGEASDDGEGEDDFVFRPNDEEFLRLIFDGAELPFLENKGNQEVETDKTTRSGMRSSGPYARLNRRATARKAHKRRTALGYVPKKDLDALRARIAELKAQDSLTDDEAEELKTLQGQLARALATNQRVPYVDETLDTRYADLKPLTEPTTSAVMFCPMDVSGSMDEARKDLAKRFYILLHRFLKIHYKRVDVVFICHTTEAWEADEEEFFYGQKSGGTVVSTGLDKAREIIEERYPPGQWNIYVAQASDGDNFSSDNDRVVELMTQEIMPVVQYFAYIEVASDGRWQHQKGESPLWRTYDNIAAQHTNFDRAFVESPKEIIPVFFELFSKKKREQKQAS